MTARRGLRAPVPCDANRFRVSSLGCHRVPAHPSRDAQTTFILTERQCHDRATRDCGVAALPSTILMVSRDARGPRSESSSDESGRFSVLGTETRYSRLNLRDDLAAPVARLPVAGAVHEIHDAAARGRPSSSRSWITHRTSNESILSMNCGAEVAGGLSGDYLPGPNPGSTARSCGRRPSWRRSQMSCRVICESKTP
jgi:hypothetical protein